MHRCEGEGEGTALREEVSSRVHFSRRRRRQRSVCVVCGVCACCSNLREAALLGLERDLVRVGLQHAPVLLAVLLVLGPRVALAQRPVHSHLECLLHVSMPCTLTPLRQHWSTTTTKTTTRREQLEHLAVIGMTPLEPTPTGMWSNSACVSCSFTGCTSRSCRFVRIRRTPQLMSKPTPPGLTTASGFAVSNAAMLPIANP